MLWKEGRGSVLAWTILLPVSEGVLNALWLLIKALRLDLWDDIRKWVYLSFLLEWLHYSLPRLIRPCWGIELSLFATDLCLKTLVYLPVPFYMTSIQTFINKFTDYFTQILRCCLTWLYTLWVVDFNLNTICVVPQFEWWKYFLHSQFPLEHPLSTPPMWNVYILPCCVEPIRHTSVSR